MVMATRHWKCPLKGVVDFSSLKFLKTKHDFKVYSSLTTAFWFEREINSGKITGIQRPNTYSTCYINKM